MYYFIYTEVWKHHYKWMANKSIILFLDQWSRSVTIASERWFFYVLAYIAYEVSVVYEVGVVWIFGGTHTPTIFILLDILDTIYILITVASYSNWPEIQILFQLLLLFVPINQNHEFIEISNGKSETPPNMAFSSSRDFP